MFTELKGYEMSFFLVNKKLKPTQSVIPTSPPSNVGWYYVSRYYRYTRVIPFSSWHGAQIGSLWVFSSSNYCFLSLKINTHTMPQRRKAHKDCGRIWFVFVFACLAAKNPKTSKWTPWLMTPIYTQGGIRGIWDLPYICGRNKILGVTIVPGSGGWFFQKV